MTWQPMCYQLAPTATHTLLASRLLNELHVMHLHLRRQHMLMQTCSLNDVRSVVNDRHFTDHVTKLVVDTTDWPDDLALPCQ